MMNYEIATGLKPFAMTRGGHYEIAILRCTQDRLNFGSGLAMTAS